MAGCWMKDVAQRVGRGVVLGLLFLLLGPTASAQTGFSEARPVDPNAPDMSAFTVADFDHDGHDDLLALAIGRILWFRNDGSGRFDAAELLMTQVPAQVNSISTADLDNDGDVDVLVGNATSFSQQDGLFWAPNEGRRLGVLEKIAVGNSGPFRVSDFDGDGDLDVIQGGLAVTLYENTGTDDERRFRFSRILAPGPAGALVLGDFDDDGDQDLVASHHSYERFNDLVFYYEQREPGRLVQDRYARLLSWFNEYTSGEYDRDIAMAVADVDGNDVPDVIINGFMEDDVPDHDGILFLYTSPAPPRPQGEYIARSPEAASPFSWGPVAMAVADLDSDGDGDIAVSRSASESDSLLWYENPGEDEMQVGWNAHRIGAVRFFRSLSAADLNNDGAIDLVALGYESTFREHLFWYENLGGTPTNAGTTEPLLHTFEVRAVWPNPSSGAVTIAYQLDQQAAVRLEVFDALGRSVATLVEAVQAPGIHEATFEVQNLPSGTYFYRLEARGEVRMGSLSRVN